MYTEKKINLFNIDTKEYALCQCISADCKMGAGIAVEFRKRFPKMQQSVYNYINNNFNNSLCTVLYNKNNTSIFNLVTKRKFYEKPTLNTIHLCLDEMYKLCEKHNITNIAMPKIGCGLDKLKWKDVSKIIQDIFNDEKYNIVVCIK